jgi:RHS repeat-associated protein
VWDGNVPVHECTQEGEGAVEVTTWVFEPGEFTPVGKVSPDGTKYSIVTDYLGTPTEMYDEAGALAWKAQLDIYGVAKMETGEASDCPWRWPGQYADEDTGLYYNRFRYYDAERGDYVSQDPIRLAGGNALYGYVPDPFAWIDPLGLSCVTANAAQGKAAEDRIAAEIDADASKVLLGRQLHVTTPQGVRKIDILFLDTVTGQVIALEVKSGAKSVGSSADAGRFARFSG